MPAFRDAAVRFWEKVDKLSGPIVRARLGRCWVWTASKHKRGGYGMFRASCERRTLKAHRVAWQLVNGDPGVLHVLHKCDNAVCVRPSHLFLGTNAENIRDRMKKGRYTADGRKRASRGAGVSEPNRWARKS